MDPRALVNMMKMDEFRSLLSHYISIGLKNGGPWFGWTAEMSHVVAGVAMRFLWRGWGEVRRRDSMREMVRKVLLRSRIVVGYATVRGPAKGCAS